ncbi:MAG: uracil-DNA glycosylase [Alphaproteobacteria bacterium]|nr:uracil-DNA glycosylase [Alphaproteobacteria bacterium]NCQ87399.1 uracil-DNA glycosylase [Alphaproteobacteria bacterium]NCT06270.1 uracil-DNA glycosylase [Alphaproteobacteria bacterium]
MLQNASLSAALQWYIDHGVDEALGDVPINRTVFLAPQPPASLDTPNHKNSAPVTSVMKQTSAEPMIGAAQAIEQAQKIAHECQSLETLKAAIAAFDGLSIKKTATQLVFADGNPQSSMMVIGEAPATEDDRQGRPFLGPEGQLMDKILGSIGLSRGAEDPDNAAYLTNILNWRPPGNRTPSQAELDIALPFLKRHIALASPKIIILCGGLVAKALLDKSESISKLRGTFHDYEGIPTIVTYHPAYLLQTPAQKRAVWADMLMIKAKRAELGLIH